MGCLTAGMHLWRKLRTPDQYWTDGLLRMTVAGLASALTVLLIALVVSSILPAGEQIAYISGGLTHFDVHLYDVRTGVSVPLARQIIGSPFLTNEALDDEMTTLVSDFLRQSLLRDSLLYVQYQPRSTLLYSLPLRGNGKKLLFKWDGLKIGPSASPDSTRIVYQADEDGDSEIYILTLETGRIIQLTFNTTFDGDPAWSPDGQQIVFRVTLDNNSDLYIMDADGQNPRRVTDNTLPKARPNWSPDGRSIVFAAHNGDSWDIHSVSVNGEDYRELTSDSARDYRPAWSPDGRHIVFESNRNGGHNRIYIMDANGSNLRVLRSLPIDSFSPVWW